MMKFASFETIVEMIYKHGIPTPKDQCNKTLQLGVSFAGGYVAGVFCAIVSHPADNLVSFLNNAKGATVSDVSLLPFCWYGVEHFIVLICCIISFLHLWILLWFYMNVCRRWRSLGCGVYSPVVFLFVLSWLVLWLELSGEFMTPSKFLLDCKFINGLVYF